MTKLYETSDLALTAALDCLGYRVEKIDKSNPAKVVFGFEEDVELQKVIQRFWNKDLLVNPTDYFNSLKALKSRIYR